MNLKINEGITTSQIKELIYFSRTDELIKKTTSDRKRFKNQSAAKSWLDKNRTIYTLVDNKDKLLGIIWFGKKTTPDKNKKYDTTFSIRLYEDARGKGLAKPFLKNAIEKYKNSNEYKESPVNGFWLITNSDNLPAIKAYQHFGFEIIPYEEKNGRILMVTEKL